MNKSKKVLCLKSNPYCTEGKSYKVTADTRENYHIITDSGNTMLINKNNPNYELEV